MAEPHMMRVSNGMDAGRDNRRVERSSEGRTADPSSSICSIICEILNHWKKRDVCFVMMEAISLILAAVGKNTWPFLLASCLVLLLAFVTTIIVHTRRTDMPSNESAEITLMVVDIGISLIQFVTTLIYFVLTVSGLQIGFRESLLSLFFVLAHGVYVCNSRRQRGMSTSGDSHTADNPQVAIDMTGTGTPEPPRYSGPASQTPPTGNAADNGDGLPSYEVTASFSGTSANLSLISVSNDPTGTTSTHELMSHSSPASQMPLIGNEADRDQLPMLNDSSPCESLNSALDSTSNDLTRTTLEDIPEPLNQSSPASRMPLIENEADKDQLPELNDSSSCEYLNSALDSTSNDLTRTTMEDIPEPLNQSSPAPQMDGPDNEA